jgi:hypothetical protein
VTQYPAEAPAWDDFGIAKQEFWETLQRIEPFRIDEGIRCFYHLYARRFGKLRWGDKTPGHIFSIPRIEQRLPEARFIHLIRDGRDVALSWKPLWFAPSDSLDDLAHHWVHWVESGRKLGQNARHYLEVRYENLVRDPQRELARVCSFLELEFEQQMLEPHRGAANRLAEHLSRISVSGKIIATREQRLLQQANNLKPVFAEKVYTWRKEMTLSQKEGFWRRAGSLLQELGYPS